MFLVDIDKLIQQLYERQRNLKNQNGLKTNEAGRLTA